MLTQTDRRKEAKAQETARATATVGKVTLAGIRVRAGLDAAMRDGLTAGDLLALADRIVSGSNTDADAAMLAALDGQDLATVNMSAAEFIMVYAAAFRAVAAVLRAVPAGTVEPILRAVAVVKDAAAILRERLQVLPDERDLDAIGERIMHGHQSPADLAVVRAVPGPWLRAHASVGHWAVFVDYRMFD